MERINGVGKGYIYYNQGFPKEEIFGLVSQMRKSAISIPSNIAEGAARSSHNEFIQFLYIALGSLAELETQLLLSKGLGYIQDIKILENVDGIRKMLSGLIDNLKRRNKT